MLKLLSQRDPRWANIHLGDSSLTVGAEGCTTTSISMLSDYFGCFHDPGQIATPSNGLFKYTEPGDPQGEGLVLWPTLNLEHMAFEKRLHGRNDAEIVASLKDPNKVVILEFQLPTIKHWCVATSRIPFVNLYWIADPWPMGGAKRLSSFYKDAIIGSAHFIRK